MSHMPRSRLALGALMVLAALAARPACAQIGPNSMPMSSPGANPGYGNSAQIAPTPAAKAPEAAPAVLPGAATRSDRVTPSRGEMIGDPTAALFDAINRGDIAAARTAIDHGANLDAPNQLGMTPLDESIDLNRNDITFLLLSLRGSDAVLQGPLSKTAKAAPGHPAATKVAPKPRLAERTPPPRPAAPTPVSEQFAGGGTPDPSAGFLGFGPSR